MLEPIEGLREGDEVINYIWEQVKGSTVNCEGRYDFYCYYYDIIFIFIFLLIISGNKSRVRV